MIHTIRFSALTLLLAVCVIVCHASSASGVVPDTADREFVKKAMAASGAELKIAALAPRNAGKEEVMALARRLSEYHVRLLAALREYARLRHVSLKGARDAQLDDLVHSFENKKGRAYDDGFRDLLARDPVELIPLYWRGAVGLNDRLLRNLSERVFGELKAQRRVAARAHLRKQIAAAQKEKKKRAKKREPAAPSAERKSRKRSAESKSPATRSVISSRKGAPATFRSGRLKNRSASSDE